MCLKRKKERFKVFLVNRVDLLVSWILTIMARRKKKLVKGKQVMRQRVQVLFQSVTLKFFIIQGEKVSLEIMGRMRGTKIFVEQNRHFFGSIKKEFD